MRTDIWPMWINGEAILSAPTFQVYDKYTGESIAEVAAGDEEAVRSALEAAQRAQPHVGALSVEERLQIVERWIDLAKARQTEFTELTVAELGRPIKLVDRFFDLGLSIPKQYREYIVATYGGVANLFKLRPAPLPGKRAYYRWEPKGVVGLCLPANDSLNLFWEKVPPMFVAGNTIVVKASTCTPLAVLLAVSLAREAGFPDGSINVVVGPSDRLARGLISHPISDYVQFVGRASHGVELSKLAVESFTEFDGEYEGNDWAFVLADADIERSAQSIVAGFTINSGQICMHVQGVVADASVYQALADRIVSLLKPLKTGDPRDPETDIGPLISAGQLERTLQQIDEAIGRGARLLAGGNRSRRCLEPTVIADVEPDMALVREESFAPALWMRKVSGVDELLEWAKLNKHRLTATIFSKDVQRAEAMAAQLSFSRVVINDDPTAVNHPFHPWGGLGISGKGGMLPWFERYTNKKFVEVRE